MTEVGKKELDPSLHDGSFDYVQNPSQIATPFVAIRAWKISFLIKMKKQMSELGECSETLSLIENEKYREFVLDNEDNHLIHDYVRVERVLKDSIP